MDYQDNPQKRSLKLVDVGGGATQERCIPIPWWIEASPATLGTQRTNFLIVVVMQQMGDKPMATCTRYLGDDLDTGAIHPY